MHILKHEHVYLTSFSKMRVDLTAQVSSLILCLHCWIFDYDFKFSFYKVLSETVAKRIRLLIGDEARETAHFIEMFDKFFDSLNVQNYTNGIRSLKPFQMLYRWANDFRIKVLLVIYLYHAKYHEFCPCSG